MRTEDGYIVDKCLNGDSAAFALLVDKYKAAVYALAYSRLRNFHDAEDVTQEVFINAYQRLRTLKRWDKFLAWLYAITYNLSKNFIRARSRRPDREFIEDQDPETLEEPSTDSYRDDLVCELINEALDSLPEMYRQVLTLHYLGGMNSREIAEFLGMSPAAVRQRLTRARSQLKEGILAMMNTTFDGQKLQASFTFRIVEAVKQMKIQPMPRATALPWGLSFAAGIIITMLSLSPYLSILNPSAIPAGSPLPVEAKVLKAGEIPVDILKTSQIPIIASRQTDGDGGDPELLDPQNAFAPALHGEVGKWTGKADMPTARHSLSTCVVDGKIYAIGGGVCTHDDERLSTVEEYDPATNAWTKKANMLTARMAPSSSTVDGEIYTIGGMHARDVFSAVEEYDPVTDTWGKKADMLTARTMHSSSVVDAKIYAIGGCTGWHDVFPTVEEYDPATNKWTKKADMPTARAGCSTSVVNGKIYAIGGAKPPYDADQVNVLSTVEEYDPKTDTWTKKDDMPTARWGLSASVVDGKILAIGGLDKAGEALPIVEKYDPVTDTWTKKGDMPTARGGLSTSVVNGKIYAIGGSAFFEGPGLPTVEEYDPQWSEVAPQGKLPKTWGEAKRVAARLH